MALGAAAPPARPPLPAADGAALAISSGPSSRTRTAGATCCTSRSTSRSAIIEFVVIVTVWASPCACSRCPLWYDAVGGASLPAYLAWIAGHDAPSIVLRALLGCGAAAGRGVALAARHGPPSGRGRGPPLHVREPRAPAPGRDPQGEPLRRPRRRGERAAPDRARPPRRRPAAPRHADASTWAWRASGSTPIPRPPSSWSSTARSRPARPWPSCATSSAGSPHRSCSIAGSCRHSARSRPAGRVPTVVRSDLPAGERLPPAIERAAYFVVAEALANVAKHSAARAARCAVGANGTQLVVEVSDDGVGGAIVQPGGGLAGLAGRVAGVDGTLTVSSPAGGPTVVRAELPVAECLSSPPVDPAGCWPRPSGAEVGEHGQHAAMVVLGVGQLELAEDAADVLLRGTFRDAQEGRDARRSSDPRPSPPAPPARAASARTAGRRPWRRTISWATTSGSSAVPPRATRRRASMNSRMSPTRSLSR